MNSSLGYATEKAGAGFDGAVAAGGVGLAAVEIGKAMGARVLAAASSEEKLALCGNVGADETINYASGNLRDRVKELTDGKGEAIHQRAGASERSRRCDAAAGPPSGKGQSRHIAGSLTRPAFRAVLSIGYGRIRSLLAPGLR